MRVVSHTCSNTEIVCALGCEAMLVGIDDDSDFPPEVVRALPRLGRDLDLDVARVAALAPDLVLTSLTVPGHERIVAGLQAQGCEALVIDPQSLEQVLQSVVTIARRLGVPARGEALAEQMRSSMPAVARKARPPAILVEWWPKPVIVPGRRSWVSDLIALAGGINPWQARDEKSLPIGDADARAAAPDAIVISWCGVREENYRADIVARREGWSEVPAVRQGHIFPISEAYLGRPGPRLVEGYRALRRIVESLV